ncbi:sigma-54-dependent Fis family transcriptional regulator [Ideonella livida]|uniref:Sigma-54-dependent Fis family transcriptional regulator n=1 Tax=Ideonella livida TaxID=2707176 RepID=A0A7C9TJH3_9BURK|nr:sigma-54-dependent Fis family transcriptional regulator [Ideonella livida]NDY92099.1 sigma-54-dependent Fis family transcriptional regulator [Ideonella livida]
MRKTPPAKTPRISLAEAARETGGLLKKGRVDQIAPGHHPTMADLTESLFFSPGDGRIWLNDQRMLLLHSSAMGHLRRELIDTLGRERARGLLTRAGYVAGARDAQLVRERWPQGDTTTVFMAGTRLHALEGIVKVTPVSYDFDIDRGTYEGEFLWEHSSEDDEHIEAYGIGTESACWTQVGYATGYVTSLFGQLVIFRELDCRSMGAAVCRVVGRNASAWGDVREDLRYLEAKDFRALAAASPPARATLHAAPPPPVAAGEGPGQARTAPAATAGGRHEIVGASSAFNSACHQLARVAPTQATVLFTGESGVGKEVFARRLHRISRRAEGPFVAVNCAAIPDTLIESELFGVERGAFTGASVSRPGRFERADGGTLFLDEIGTLSLVSQGKLLRALQEGEIERVGGSKTVQVDVRLVAATNVDLLAEVEAGRFREDLYYRLNVFPMHLPPLRERRDDIPLLMNHFLQRECARHGREVVGFTPRAVRALLGYAFPGNIRELQNLVERGVISAEEGKAIDVPHLFRREQLSDETLLALGASGHLGRPASADPQHLHGLLRDALGTEQLSLDALEARLLRDALLAHEGNVSAAARSLGLSRAQFAYRLDKQRPAAAAD